MTTDPPPTLDYRSRQPRVRPSLRFVIALMLGGLFGFLFGVITFRSGSGFICVGPPLAALGSSIMVTVADRRRMTAALFHNFLTSLSIVVAQTADGLRQMRPEVIGMAVIDFFFVSLFTVVPGFLRARVLMWAMRAES